MERKNDNINEVISWVLSILVIGIILYFLFGCSPVIESTTKSNYEFEKVVKYKDGSIRKESIKEVISDSLTKKTKL